MSGFIISELYKKALLSLDCKFFILRILPLVFLLSFMTAPALAWGEGGCPFSKMNKLTQDATIEQVENSDFQESNFMKMVNYKPYIFDLLSINSNIIIPIFISISCGSPKKVSNFSKGDIVSINYSS